jgi:hypothetical protein
MDLFTQLITEGKLSQEEATQLTESLNTAISEKVKMQVDVQKEQIIAEARESFTTEANAHFRAEFEKVKETLTEKDAIIAEQKEQLESTESVLAEAIQKLESNTNKKLDLYLESALDALVPQDTLEKLAKLEKFESLFESIGSLVQGFQKPEVDIEKIVESKVSDKIAESKDLVESLQKDKETLTESNIKLMSESSDLKKKLLIISETQDLTESERTQVYKYFETKNLAETKTHIGEYKTLLKESVVQAMQDSFKRGANRQKSSNSTTEQRLDESRSLEVVEQSSKPIQRQSGVASELENASTILDD